MQKRDQSKAAGAGGSSPAPTPPKRGRPFGSTSNNIAAAAAAAAAAGDSMAPPNLFGPSLQLHTSFIDHNSKRIVLALQSGLKGELTWALNALTMLSFKEKEDMRKDSLTKIPGLLDALLQVIDDWRDIAVPKDSNKPRSRTLGANSVVSGFGNGYDALGSNNIPTHPGLGSGSVPDTPGQRNAAKVRQKQWWFDEDGLFNLDEEGRAEKQQCAVGASNIIRNFSFMPENEVVMAQHRHCLETVFQCIEDHSTEDEELVTNSLETIVNLAPLLDLRIFSSSKPSYIKMTEKRAVEAIMGMVGSGVKAWHCAAAELLGRMIINPDNEPFLLPFVPQIHKRLVDLLSIQALDAQAAAVGALYNLAEVNMDCRLKLASERWAVDRLLKVIRTPHPVPEVCRKAAMIIESLVAEPQNKYAASSSFIVFVESGT
ncbi:Armadillo repeat-containing protein LFR [Euphorbia peplus]|nr:Armadillo repeat-containing protein LFR [Euphorbia peplus]